MKKSSYQKLKDKISKLEEREKVLITDIFNLTRNVPFEMEIMTKTTWNMYFDLEEITWLGHIKSKKNG